MSRFGDAVRKFWGMKL